DPLAENKDTNKRYRADKLIQKHNPNIDVNGMSLEAMTQYLIKTKVVPQDQENWQINDRQGTSGEQDNTNTDSLSKLKKILWIQK
ncbi:MAG: hypothetical protein Q8772_02790, partial [Candidatus Phytoplasma australasiaticum]|nr:hypothetical protein [Candidatus Phytoplasma australasiaticum]